MKGDTRSQRGAWETYDLMLADERIWLLPEPEPEKLDVAFRELTSADRASSRQWPDAYLAAFANTSELSLVTFDRPLHQMSGGTALLLS